MKNVILALTMIISIPSNWAYGGTVLGTGGALEVTQWSHMLQEGANSVKQIIELKNMLGNMRRQYQNLETNTSRLNHFDWGNTSQQLMNLSNAVRDGHALAYSLNQIDSEFKNKFQGYGEYLRSRFGSPDFYSNKYNEWSQTNLDTIRSSMKAANMQSNQFTTEERTLNSLESMGQSATGRMQALQVGHQISAQQVRQTQKLRQLMMSQMQMQASFMATKQDQDALLQARSNNFYKSNQTIRTKNGNRY